jgi:hypothetical protein
VRISGPVLVCSVQLQTCIYTAALRGTRFSEARLLFMFLIMSTQNMVFGGDDNTELICHRAPITMRPNMTARVMPYYHPLD